MKPIKIEEMTDGQFFQYAQEAILKASEESPERARTVISNMLKAQAKRTLARKAKSDKEYNFESTWLS